MPPVLHSLVTRVVYVNSTHKNTRKIPLKTLAAIADRRKQLQVSLMGDRVMGDRAIACGQWIVGLKV